jgi:hypothetical protein
MLGHLWLATHANGLYVLKLPANTNTKDMVYVSQVQLLPYNTLYMELPQLQTPATPFNEKLNAVMAMNDDCSDAHKPKIITRKLKELLEQQNSQVQLHNYGTCDRSGVGEKELREYSAQGAAALMRRYKFCLVCLFMSQDTSNH